MDAVATDGTTTALHRSWRGTGHLGDSECWRYLRSVAVGRLAVVDEDGVVDVHPVNHAVDRNSLLLWTPDGTTVRGSTTGRDVAYEVHGVDDVPGGAGTAWSVVLRGRAEVVTDGAGSLLVPAPAPVPGRGGPQAWFVRVSGAATGRRFAVTGAGWWS